MRKGHPTGPREDNCKSKTCRIVGTESVRAAAASMGTGLDGHSMDSSVVNSMAPRSSCLGTRETRVDSPYLPEYLGFVDVVSQFLMRGGQIAL